MTDPLYVAARGVLLDALEGLGEQRDALILAGAQAIYVHTGAADLAIAETAARSITARRKGRTHSASSVRFPATVPHFGASGPSRSGHQLRIPVGGVVVARSTARAPTAWASGIGR